jgi:hypothetical protein
LPTKNSQKSLELLLFVHPLNFWTTPLPNRIGKHVTNWIAAQIQQNDHENHLGFLLSSSFSSFFLPPNSHGRLAPTRRTPSGRLHLEEEEGGARVEGWRCNLLGTKERDWGGCKRGRERGGGQRGGGVRGRGRLGLRGKLMGSPPPDRDPRPKLALTSAPDPSAQIQQVFYCFTGECFLKNSNPNYTDHERKGKNKFNFFSENWVSHSTPLKKNSTSNSNASIGTTRKDQ